MKKLFLFAVLGVVMLLGACALEDNYPQLVEQVEIKPEFEQTPPIAEDLWVEVLEKDRKTGENIRLVAQFAQGAVTDTFLAVMVGEQKIVLRDDGRFADEEAGDGKFSVFVKDDVDQVEESLENRQNQLLENDLRTLFEGREAVALSANAIDSIAAFKPSLTPGVQRRLPLRIFPGLFSLTDPDKTLMITDPGVIEDPGRTFNPCDSTGTPNGVWTFGELMRQMASPNPAAIATDAQVSSFVLDWLQSWSVLQTVNSDDIPPRGAIFTNIINPWLNASAAAGAPAGELRMELAPFRLLAIVNRLDLRGNSGYGFSDAGEGRFVFGAMDRSCNPLRFTVIFEYGINKRRCADVKAFAQEWVDLDAMTLGTAAYNNALENITNQFTRCGTNTAKPNQNSINQIRTNEIALGGPWELREFNLMASGQLEHVTVKQEPAGIYNGQTGGPTADVERMAWWVNLNGPLIVNDQHVVPLEIPQNPPTPVPTVAFLGSKSQVPSTSSHWDGRGTTGSEAIIDDQVRHKFSFNTCIGCHARETDTDFLHIEPTPFGSPPNLSGFLTGISVTDPAGRPAVSPAVRNFNDLLRRNIDLGNLASRTCRGIVVIELAEVLRFDPLRMTH